MSATPPPSSPLPSSSPLPTLTTLLSTLHSHLNAQTQLLPTLHVQLGLPPTALEDELRTLQRTLTRAVEAQIEVRRKEVQGWITKYDAVESECARYMKALGSNAKVVGLYEAVNDLRREQVLPKRHERAMEYKERLRQIYHAKLEQLTTLTNRLGSLSRTLGSNFFSHAIEQLLLTSTEGDDDSSGIRDVCPERFSKLEKELVRGKGEMTKRLNQLAETFVQTDWLYTELGMDPPAFDAMDPGFSSSSSSTLPVPHYPLPKSSSTRSSRSNHDLNADPFLSSTMGVSTPTPTSHTKSDLTSLCRPASPPPYTTQSSSRDDVTDDVRRYYAIFGRFVSLLDASSSEQPSPASFLASLSVEPTKGILLWADRVLAELGEVKKRREAHIQAMYDQLEGLWKRMGVEDDAMDGFVEANRGTTPLVIQAYEEELERMLELKRERMSEFIGNARVEIYNLWDELMVGEAERAEFAAFVDDEHTEDLLSQHEHEIARLKAEVKLKTPFLTSIRKYFEICDEEKELERAACDQTRLLGRAGGRDPGRLLREEKMRKRVGREKPKLEQQLLTALPSWEQTHGRTFLVHGESMLHMLMENMSANDQENKKKGPASQYSMKALRSGSQALKAADTHSNVDNNPRSETLKGGHGGYIPGKSTIPTTHVGAVTPAIRPSSSMSMTSNYSRSSKRQKLTESIPPVPRIPSRTSPAKGRTPSTGSSALPRPIPHSMSTTSVGKHMAQTQAYGGLGLGRPPQGSQSRAVSHGSLYLSTSTSLGSSLSSSMARNHGAGSVASATMEAQREAAARKASRLRRESFKPRPSEDGALLSAVGIGAGRRGHDFKGMSVTEEQSEEQV